MELEDMKMEIENVFKVMYDSVEGNPPLEKLIRIDCVGHPRHESFMYIFLDQEGDPITCYFNYDDCVQIDVSKYHTDITLDADMLETLSNLIFETDMIFRKEAGQELS